MKYRYITLFKKIDAREINKSRVTFCIFYVATNTRKLVALNYKLVICIHKKSIK